MELSEKESFVYIDSFNSNNKPSKQKHIRSGKCVWHVSVRLWDRIKQWASIFHFVILALALRSSRIDWTNTNKISHVIQLAYSQF